MISIFHKLASGPVYFKLSFSSITNSVWGTIDIFLSTCDPALSCHITCLVGTVDGRRFSCEAIFCQDG